MRLSIEEVAAIKAASVSAFGPDAVVRLFGSRVDDTRRGGDIDLHVEVAPGIDEWSARTRFDEGLFARIEDQRVDLVIRHRGTPLAGIDRIAIRDGVIL